MATGDSLRDLSVKPGEGVSARRHNDLLRRLSDMSFGGAGGRRSAQFKDSFFISPVSALSVIARGGNIKWHNLNLVVADSSAITITPSSSHFYIWIALDNEFSNTRPTATFESGATGWANFPDQPNPPAARFFLITDLVSSATAITSRTDYWNGGDIIWPPSFGPFYM